MRVSVAGNEPAWGNVPPQTVVLKNTVFFVYLIGVVGFAGAVIEPADVVVLHLY